MEYSFFDDLTLEEKIRELSISEKKLLNQYMDELIKQRKSAKTQEKTAFLKFD